MIIFTVSGSPTPLAIQSALSDVLTEHPRPSASLHNTRNIPQSNILHRGAVPNLNACSLEIENPAPKPALLFLMIAMIGASSPPDIPIL
jgi:hypothetical protein